VFTEQTTASAGRVVDRILALAEDDVALRDEIVELAEHIVTALRRRGDKLCEPAQAERATEEPPVEDTQEAESAAAATPAESDRKTARVSESAPTAPPPAEVEPTAFVATRPEVTDADLPLVEARLRLKAEGARWAAKRRQMMSGGADFQLEVEPLDREIIERAKQVPDCFLWMCHPSGPAPSDPSQFETLADAFDSTQSAVALVRRVLADSNGGGNEDLEQAMLFLAEAQSALRVAVERLGARADKDQQRAYFWLKDACAQRAVFVPRYMRLDDPADPEALELLDQRVDAADAEYARRRGSSKARESGLKRIRYHLKSIASGDGDHGHDWRRVVDTVDLLVGDGLPPSNVELRELLLPVVEQVPGPESLPQNVRLVLREIDRYVATRQQAEPTPQEQDSDWGDEARRVADLLRGRSVILIGGVRRRHAHEALRQAFELRELEWVEAQEHESISTFESYVARPDAAVVLLAIRWSSHSFGEVRAFCERYGKPLVRLPAGYNPRQVAAQILAQCSGMLEA
jgi:hypothetical protein